MSAALETRALVKRFGGLVATHDVSLTIERGARHALIGPNGAGKTTLINLLTGVLEPSAGRIVLDGEDVTRMPAHRRVRRGLVRTFQINQLFGALTPLQSLALTVAQRLRHGARWWQPLGRDPRVAEACERLLQEFHLTDVMDQRTSVLLIEHDMDLVFNFAKQVTVLVNGAVFAEGDAASIAADPRVKAVYLGQGHG